MFLIVCSRGNPAVILLAFVLAIGFLLVILSCALFQNWLPLFVALTFVLAPAPNALANSCARGQDFNSEYDSTSPIVDFGRFMTSCTVVTGFALPIVLSHAQIIHPVASLMSLVGGGLIYVTITAYSAVFRQEEDEF
ncbi:vacuolar protein sorting 55 protein [Clavulina sp. PMI_390]|nr:vacuolar protein sorting 55 protein [Clavulina sp. PMI_390]